AASSLLSAAAAFKSSSAIRSFSSSTPSASSASAAAVAPFASSPSWYDKLSWYQWDQIPEAAQKLYLTSLNDQQRGAFLARVKKDGAKQDLIVRKWISDASAYTHRLHNY